MVSKRARAGCHSLTAIFLALCLGLIAIDRSSSAETETVTLHPEDTGEALVNPDMGWTFHFYSNIPANYGSRLAPSDTLDDFPGLSTVYLRVPWAYLEPREGEFNWALLDTPAQRWIAKGKRIALRITCSENWMPYATPEWVKNAGAKGCFYVFGKGPSPEGKSWDPDFGDPVFLEKLDRFLEVMAARYDSNPNVAFIDIGSYGLWGEGHTMMSSRVPEDKAREIVRKHIDLYAKHFKHTLLCISDDVAGPEKQGAHFPETDYALSKGVTLRDDSILVQPPPKSWFHAEMAQAFWPRWPVILEHEHYGGSKRRGAWGDGSLLLKAIEEYHASYMSIHWWARVELEENRALIDKINLRLGYRLQLREVSWPAAGIIGKPFAVGSVWANAGVAPCYPGGFLTITLKDAQGGIVSACTDEQFDFKELAPGPGGAPSAHILESRFVVGLIAPVTKPGDYTVFVSVGQRDGTPRIALPLEGDDGQRRYRLGEMTLRAEVAQPEPIRAPPTLPGLRKLLDMPLRDPSIDRGPDGTWYLTGTVPPFWSYNEGIKVWKSRDLTHWIPLGFVWKYGASPWHKKYLEAKKPLWAPEIHYLKGTFWLTYSMPGWDATAKTSGSGLLRSVSGNAEGPYVDMHPEERLGDEIDASLFEDDDGSVYFLWHCGKIARMKADMSGFSEPYHWLKTTASDPDPRHHSGLCAGIFGKDSFNHVGYEGAFIFKSNGRYYLSCAEGCDGRYSSMISTSTNIYGPYGPRYEAIPHGGHNTFFKDEHGQWWSTFFGSDETAPWREQPGLLPIRFDRAGTVRPGMGDS